jgi:hypothetical protein
VTVVQVALEEWLDRDDRTLFEVMLETIGSLQATMAAFPPLPPGPASRQLPRSQPQGGHVQEGILPSA